MVFDPYLDLHLTNFLIGTFNGKGVELVGSLGNPRGYNASIDPYCLILENMRRGIFLPALSPDSNDYSKALLTEHCVLLL